MNAPTDYDHFKKSARWRYAQDVYTGEAFDYYESDESVNVDSQRARLYFPKKESRESAEAYSERLKLLDPNVDFATGIDSLNGVLFSSESKSSRTWFDENGGLGDPSDMDSISREFMQDADGNGTNYNLIVKRAGIKLCIKHTIGVLVEGIPRSESGDAIGGASVKLIEPESIVRKVLENGRLIAVRIQEERADYQSLDDKAETYTCYIDYTLEGWKRWRYVGEVKETIDEGTYSYYRTSDQRNSDRILPFFEVTMPIERMVGWIWAKKCISLSNLISALDFAYRNTSFALFVGSMSETQWNGFLQKLAKGANALRLDPESKNKHEFIAPPSDHFDSMKEYIIQKRKDFFYGMFKDYGDVAKEATATQVRLESQSGIEAFLVLLASALDEMENQILWRVSQVYLPNSPNEWGIAHVERSTDFSPVDIEAMAEQLAERYFTGLSTVPANANVLQGVLAKIFKSDGLSQVTEEDLEEIASNYANAKAQERDVDSVAGV